MATEKKFTVRVVQENETWAAELVRRVSARRTKVSKRQDGFSSEAEATAWAEKELKQLLANVYARRMKKERAAEAASK